MIRKYLLLIFVTALFGFSSCRQENGSPVRNVRFDPNLLNQMKDGSSCASHSYFYEDKEVNLGAVFTKQVLVAFAAGSTYEEQKTAMEKYGFVKGVGYPATFSSGTLFNLSLIDGLSCSQTEQALKVLSKDRLVTYAAPYFVQQSNLLGVSNETIVTVQEGKKATLDDLLQAYGASVVTSLGENIYVVEVDKSSKGNALELANYLKLQEGIAHAEPNFVVSDAPANPASSLRNLSGTTRR